MSTLHDFAAAVRQVLGDARIEIGGGRDPPGLGPIYGRMDITGAAADLGYTPEHHLARGVADYVESLRRLDLQPTAGVGEQLVHRQRAARRRAFEHMRYDPHL